MTDDDEQDKETSVMTGFANQASGGGGDHSRRITSDELSEPDGIIHSSKIVTRKASHNRLAAIDAEIEAIRKRCEVKVRVDIGDVVVKGHKRKYDDYAEEDLIDDEIHKHIAIDTDDEKEAKRIKISKIGIKRVKPGENDEGYTS